VSVNAQTILNAAYADLGVIGLGDTLDASLAQDGLRRLNALVNSWGTQTKTMPFIARQVFPTTGGKGGPSNPYTIGPGGDFDTSRPAGLTGAGLLLNSSSPPVEIPRGVLTDDGWEAIQIKDLSNALWTNVYFNATYSNNLATINLWPVPNTSQNSCVIYRRDIIQGFADLTTAYDFPYGYQEALQYNVAVRMARANGVPLSTIPDVVALASQTLGAIKRANYTITDLPIDPAITLIADRRAGYNINTGTGGGS